MAQVKIMKDWKQNRTRQRILCLKITGDISQSNRSLSINVKGFKSFLIFKCESEIAVGLRQSAELTKLVCTDSIAIIVY